MRDEGSGRQPSRDEAMALLREAQERLAEMGAHVAGMAQELERLRKENAWLREQAQAIVAARKD